MCRFLCILLVLGMTTGGTMARERPNVLLIAVDDLNDWIGCMGGHPQAKTPHIDRLAARGMLFTNAHCQSPVCNPSRASLMSSLYPSTSGIYFLNPDLKESPVAGKSRLMPQRFEEEGYAVSGAGKLFHGGQNQQYVPNYAGGFGSFGPRPKSKLSSYPGHPLWDWGVFPERDELMPDYQIASWAETQLAEKRDRPFWMGVGFFRPHVPQYAPQKWFDLYPLDTLQLPRVIADDLDDISRYGMDVTRLKHVAPTHEWVTQNQAWKPLVQSYLACVSFVDAQIGRILDALESSPYKDHTFIVLFSDHGFHLGEKERHAKRSLWEDGTRTPMIIVGPGIAQGKLCNQPVQLLDMYPTLLELTGLEADPSHEGHSLKPLLNNPETAWPHMARTSFGPGNYSVVSRQFRFIQYNDGSEELYDHAVDPHEWHNVAGNPEYGAAIKQHREHVPQLRHAILGKGSTGHESYAASEERRTLKPDADPSMNVLFILADDLGWSDTTLFGTTELYQTPNIERLARRGLTFTRAYANSPLCSPTRASILTGQLPARHGSTAPVHHTNELRLVPTSDAMAKPGQKATGVHSVSRLDTAYPTLGKLIREAGYSTAHFGKWHLGPEPYSPLEHGFETDIPHHPGPGPAGSYVAPWKFRAFKANSPGEHLEDRMAEEAVAWLKSRPAGKPFYMNYWQFSVHAPFDAKQELMDEYRPKIDPDSQQKSATYAAMVHSLDDAVGALLDTVDAAGLADQTVIVFTSDNGGNMYDRIREDGDVAPTSNHPLRGGKATMYEGGIRVPCIVIWPGVTTPGSRSEEVIQTSDFYPTLLNGLGIQLPDHHAVDGIDIMPALQGGKLNRNAIFTFFPHAPPVPDWLPPSISVHAGDWKLIRLFYGGENGAHDYRLYHLSEDIGEQHNLASSHPAKVQALDRMIEQAIQDTGTVGPRPNPNFNPAMYHPERIGLPSRKWASPKTSAQKPGVVVKGWVGEGTSTLSHKEGRLVVTSTGGDPYCRVKAFEPLQDGPFKVTICMKSNADGAGAVFYNHPSPDRRILFPMQHDGPFHEVSINIPVSSLTGLRFDPGTGVGIIEVDWIRLYNQHDEMVRSWEF